MAIALNRSDPRTDVLQTVADVGEVFTSSLQLQPCLEYLIYTAVELVGGSAGAIMVSTPRRDELTVVAAVGPEARADFARRHRARVSVAGRGSRPGQTLALKCPVALLDTIVSEHPQLVDCPLVVPLRLAGRLLGVLSVNTPGGASRLSPATFELVRVLANQAALVVEHARLIEDVERKERRLERLASQCLHRREARLQPEPANSQSLRRAVAGTAGEPPAGRAAEARSAGHVAERLTERERQVLALVVQGLINKEIGRRLRLSPNTVKNHVASIMQKLGVADRTQAAVLALRLGLAG